MHQLLYHITIIRAAEHALRIIFSLFEKSARQGKAYYICLKNGEDLRAPLVSKTMFYFHFYQSLHACNGKGALLSVTAMIYGCSKKSYKQEIGSNTHFIIYYDIF
eukprot:TRINITY_DN29470_c2_g1_i1.p1 TRINITY_DN29470_c2_g1~~TRINITY_DN29470_c2_g1_i1.p1  ORF type:complete len:105 (-),score=0.49 TRINITY_DN29470_c2_g1_i1:210-524(-)